MTDYFSKAIGLDNSQTAAQPVDYFSKAIGLEKPQAQEEPKTKQEGWGEWIVNSVRGRQDPKEAATGTVFEQFPSELGKPTANAAIFGASDAGMADVIKNNLGDRFIRQETDSNGYPVIVSRGANGQEQRGYVNKPGLDLQDVSRAVYGSLPYMAIGGVAGVAGRSAGIGVNALLQGGAAGATSVAGDVAASQIGSEQGVDLGKAGIMAGFGAAGPVVSGAAGALWRKFVTIPGYLDKSTGQLTAKGLEAAKAAGIDPADISPDFAQGFAKVLAETKDPAQAAIKAGAERYGIPATRGQITKDPYLLTQEEGMRRRLYGESAQDTIRGFDARQAAAVSDAALGRMGGTGGKSVAETINPKNAGLRPGPQMVGETVQTELKAARAAAKSAESKLWDDNVRNLSATPQARATLRPFMDNALDGETAFYPTGDEMAKAIGSFADGNLPVTQSGGITLKPIQSVDQMRRHLGNLVGKAAPGSDKHQAGKIYDAFNDWIADSAKNNLLDGDPAAAMQLIKARGFTKEVRELFSPRAADGTKAPAAVKMSKILDSEKADSGEAVIQSLFGSQGAKTAGTGTVSTLKNIKTALDKFAPNSAKQTWDDIRLSYWSRLVTSKTGEMVGPQAVVSNLKAAFQNQGTVLRTLYSPQELMEMKSFLKAMEAVAYKPPNASGSGYTVGVVAKDWMLKLLDSFGLGKPAAAALNYTGVGNAWNAATARQAVSGAVRPRAPNLTPAITSAGQAYNQSR